MLKIIIAIVLALSASAQAAVSSAPACRLLDGVGNPITSTAGALNTSGGGGGGGGTVDQGTAGLSPWLVSGTVTANQGTTPWIQGFSSETVAGTITQAVPFVVDAAGFNFAYVQFSPLTSPGDSANGTLIFEDSVDNSVWSFPLNLLLAGAPAPIEVTSFPFAFSGGPQVQQVRFFGRFLRVRIGSVSGTTGTVNLKIYLKSADNFDDVGKVNASVLVSNTGFALQTLDGAGQAGIPVLGAAGEDLANSTNQTSEISKLTSIVTNTTGLATSGNQSTANTALSSIVTNTGHIPASPAQDHTSASTPESVRLTDGTTFYKSTTPADTQPVSIATLPALSPGAQIIGKVTMDLTTPGTTNAVSIGSSGSVALMTGSSLIGKVGIDQTTNGTTNRVNIGTDGAVAGVGNFTVVQPTAASLNGTMVTTAGATIARDSTLGSPFQAGGSIGNTSFISTQDTAANLNGTMVTTGGATIAKDSSITALTTALGTPMQQTGGSVAGTLTHNNAAPGANNFGAIGALANASPPSLTEGDQVLHSVDLSGNLRTNPHPGAALGYYSWGGTTGAYAGLSANTPLFSMRWTDSTHIATILKVEVMVITTTAATTAAITERQLIVARSFTASDTGGTSATLTGNNQKRRTSQGTSLMGDMRIGNPITAGTRTLDSAPMSTTIAWAPLNGTGVTIGGAGSGATGAAFASMGGRGGVKLLDAINGEDYPITLAQNEGIVVRLGAAEPSGATQQTFVNVIWSEETNY